MKKLLSLLLAICMVFSLAACGGEDEPEPTPEFKPASEVQAEILAGIQPDTSVSGTLIVYSPNSNGEINAIKPGFAAKYPNVQLEIVSMGTGDVLSKANAEKGNPSFDVMWGGMNYEKWYNNQGLWEEYVSPNEVNIKVESAKNTTGFFTSYGLSGNTAFVVNTEVLADLGLKPEDITGYQSLADHADVLKGNVLSANPVASSSAWQEYVAMIYVYGGGQDSKWDNLNLEGSWAYVKEFIKCIDGSVLSSSSAVYKNVVAGEAAIGVTYEDPALQLLKDEAENIVMVYPKEGNNWTPCAAAIVKDAPNKELAKLFIDFLISTEGQALYACTTLRTVSGAPNILKGFLEFDQIPNIFDQDQLTIAQHTAEWKDKWTELLNEYNATK